MVLVHQIVLHVSQIIITINGKKHVQFVLLPDVVLVLMVQSQLLPLVEILLPIVNTLVQHVPH